MSAAVNNHSTLKRIVSNNLEGIDRKLNVAVTRAREQFILLGNEKLLATENSYKALMNMSKKMASVEIEHTVYVDPVT